MAVCLVLFMAVFACVGCAPPADNSSAGGSGGGSSQEETALQRIVVTTKPAKTTYVVGEKLDLTGMVVTAYYTDGTSEAITGYTVDKTGELTREDKAVTVSYQGKIAMFPITVVIAVGKALDIETADNAVYRIEAESLDYSNCVNSTDQTQPPAIEAGIASASGQQSIGGLSVVGNSFGFAVESKVEAELTIVARLAAVAAEQELDSTVSVLWNGESQYSGGVLPWDDATRNFYNWQNIYFTGLTLEEGTNELVLEILSSAPNVDCFWLIVSPTGEEELPLDGVAEKPEGNEPSEYASLFNITSNAAQSYRIEAESPYGVDYTNCWTTARDEGTTTASGGLCRSALGTEGNQFGFAIDSETEATFSLRMRVCCGNPVDQALDEILKITWNGVEIKTGCVLDFPTEEWEADPAAPVWFLWQDATVDGLTLRQGRNELNIQVLTDSAPNIDYFQLDVAGGSEEVIFVPPIAAAYDTFLTVENAEEHRYTVEAEALDFSDCVNSTDPTGTMPPAIEAPATETSGGKSVGGLSTPGNRFGLTVESAAEADLTLVLVLSSGTHGEQAVDDCWKIVWNDTQVVTGHTLAWNGTWHQWEEVRIEGLKLNAGKNVLDITVLAASPNVDCFYFDVAPAGSYTPSYGTFVNVESAEHAVYTVEAEALDWSGCDSSNNPGQQPNKE